MGLLERYHLQVYAVQRLADPLIVVSGLWLLARLYEVPLELPYQILSCVAAMTVAMTFGAAGAYRTRRAASLMDAARVTLFAWVVALSILLAIAYATKTSELFSRRVLLTWALVMPVALVAFHIAVRAVLRTLRARGRNTRSYVIVGGGQLARRLQSQVASTAWFGLRPLGYFDDRPPRSDRARWLPYLGQIEDLAQFARAESLNVVYIALPMHRQGRIQEVMDLLADTAASVYLVPDIFTFQLLNARTEHLDGMPVIGLRETPFAGVEGWVKRVEDVVLASLILALISPVLLLVAAGVKLTSPGPVLFKQRRYGLDGQAIRVYKFRTMTVCEDGDVVAQARKNDARVTRFGAFLRQTSLDELPQFWNVLQGRMSIVGPRPHAVAHNEHYRRQIKGYMLRHKVRPGITGLAQVNGYRGETDTLEKMEKRVAYDLNYIRGWSLQLDLKIIAQTIVRGFRGDSAY